MKFDDTEIKICKRRCPISIDYIDINKIVVSNKVSFGKKDFKYFIGYKYAKKLDLYAYFFQKLSAYRRDLDKTKCMSFSIKDTNLLKKYNENLQKKSATLSKKEFDSEPVCNEKYLKTKKINTNFHNNKIPKECSQCICLLVTIIHKKKKKRRLSLLRTT